MNDDELVVRAVAAVPGLSLADLAGHATAEFDEPGRVRTPGSGSAGEVFLRGAAQAFVAFLADRGMFPDPQASDDMSVEAAATDLADELGGSTAVQAYVDLALYDTGHAYCAINGSAEQLRRALQSAADTIALSLTERYGPGRD